MSGAPKRRQGHSVEPAGCARAPAMQSRGDGEGRATGLPPLCAPDQVLGTDGHTLSRPNRPDTTDAARASARCSVTEGWFPVHVETVLPEMRAEHDALISASGP